MKSRNFTRFTIYKVLLVLFLLASIAIPWSLMLHTRALHSEMSEQLTRHNLTYTRLTRIMRENDTAQDVIPVTHGEVVRIELDQPLQLITGRRSGRDITQTIPAGTVLETTFFSVAMYQTGYRECYLRVIGVEGGHRMTFHTLRTRDFARVYRSYLEQNGLEGAFETETGRSLSQHSAVWSLRSIDRELLDHQILCSTEVPYLIDHVRNACHWSLLLFLPLLVLGFWLVDRRKHTVLNCQTSQLQSQAESDRWAETAKRLSTQAPIHSDRKQPRATLIPEFDAWCRTAVQYVPRFRRGTVYAELYAHLSDHYQALLEGRDPEAAARMALTAMGSAEETGRRLRRSEWSVSGMIRNLQFLLSGSRWVVLYRGSDVKRYARLVDELTYAQIPFRREELDGFTRSNLANIVPGRGTMDNTPRRDGTAPSLHAALATSPLRENFPDQYIIYVRQRDMGATNRLSRT